MQITVQNFEKIFHLLMMISCDKIVLIERQYLEILSTIFNGNVIEIKVVLKKIPNRKSHVSYSVFYRKWSSLTEHFA